MKRTIALAATLLVALIAAVLASRPPSPPAHPAADQFHTADAMTDIRAIARQGHPIGSAEHARVRDYLLGRLRGLGLETRVQSGEAVEARSRGDRTGMGGGYVENLIGVLPGKDRGLQALVVQAHYDSVPNSPGAADDATGVGVLLDVARALKVRGQPERDVVFLITDGEEAGLLGARSFYASDPLAKRIGMVLNMEARGGGGRVSMFETSDGNGGLIDAFRKVTPNATSTSLAIFIYQHMPNDTDLTVVKQAGLKGLNWAFIDREFDYHAGSSTPANLDQSSVQHMGQQVLGVAQAFAYARELPQARADVVYSDLLGHAIVAYPQWGGWLALLAAAGLIGAAFARVRKSEGLSWVEAAKGAGGLVLAVLLTGLLAYGARIATGLPIDYTGARPLLAQFGKFEAAILAFGLGSMLVVFALLAGRRGRPWSAWLGVLLLGLVLGGVLQWLAPPTAFLAAWPLLAAAVAAVAAAYSGDLEGPASLTATTLVGGLMLGQVLYVAQFVALGVGADMPAVLAVFVLLAGIILTPLMWQGVRAPAASGALVLVVGLGLILAVRVTDPSSPRYPRATEVYHVTEDGKTWRVAATPDDNAWTKAVLSADGGKVETRELRGFGDKVLMAQARPVATAPVQATASMDADGRVTVRMAQAADSRQLRLSVRSDKPITAAVVNGERKAMAARRLSLAWSAPGRPLEVVLEAPAGARLDIKAAELRDGWPKDAAPLPARPADAMAWGNSDSTVSMVSVPVGR